ncbi:MAG: hypothetical protein EOL97_06395 [Spirochaetia bacterium]|nr:hypothetical protein [Spirochaetia bacterium]
MVYKIKLAFYSISIFFVLTLTFSLYGYNKISSGYKNIIDFQIEQNNYFLEIDDLNNQLSSGYMFQQINNFTKIQAIIDELRFKNNQYKNRTPISRDQLDFYFLVDTYLESSLILLNSLEVDSKDSLIELEKLQDLYSFINESFKNLYNQEIEFISIAQNEMDRFAKNTLLLNMALLLFLIVLGLIINRQFKDSSNKMYDLTKFAKSIKNNPYSNEKIEINSNDELSFFATAFNEMIETIQFQMKEKEAASKMREELKNVEIQRLKVTSQLKSSQLKLLQSRVNPHFLFNTLNMIKSTAINEDFTKTAQLIEATAELYRYYLSSQTHDVTLEKEIENLRNYAFIQKNRFGSRISFNYVIDENLLSLSIPSMVLQPLVENSIVHGIKKIDANGIINIEVKEDNNRLLLSVIDNGIGFSRDQISQIINKCKENEISDNIGLRNVYQRLMYYFNDDVKLSIESDWDTTTVSFSLPILKEGY